MRTYLDLVQHVLDHGEERGDRTGTGTISVFGYQSRYNLQEGFPIVTTKRVWWRGVVEELLWMLSGSGNKFDLEAKGITIWSEWGNDETGELGPVYGVQWRTWPTLEGNTLDQLGRVIEGLQNNPESRRHVMSTWNAGQIDEMALPPCHGVSVQFYVRKGKYLDCHMYQRSGDVFLGIPFNISSYSLLTHMIAQVVGLEPGEFIHTIGDAHIYSNHLDQVREQLTRDPLPLPTLRLNPEITDIDDFTFDDIELIGYKYHPAIKAPVAV